MTNCMSDTEKSPGAPARRNAAKAAPQSREDRLAEALRANLRRRKAAAKKPDAGGTENDSPAAQSDAEKPANRS